MLSCQHVTVIPYNMVNLREFWVLVLLLLFHLNYIAWTPQHINAYTDIIIVAHNVFKGGKCNYRPFKIPSVYKTADYVKSLSELSYQTETHTEIYRTAGPVSAPP